MTREYNVDVTDDVNPDAFQRFENYWSPEQEIVRCKDCKKRGQSVYRTDGAEYIVCWNQGFGIQHPIDWFCADGKRDT